MKELMNRNKSGLIFGTYIALLHILWSILVAFGIGNDLISFVASLHFLNIVLTIQPFDIINSLILVVVTFVVGYILGFLFAIVVNWHNKK